MKALLSNDDGYLSPALTKLEAICKKHCDVIKVIAPDRNRSGASSSLTLRQKIYIHKHTNGYVSVEGTPTDSVYVGLLGAFDECFDIVISGINLGANLADDVIYSGTVAAAMEGRFLKYPPIAISMTSPAPKQFETAEYVIDRILKTIQIYPHASTTLLNVNIPDIPLAELKGIKLTRLGVRHPSNNLVKEIDQYGHISYQIGEVPEISDKSPDTDVWAIENNYASVTPLHKNFSHSSAINSLADWIKQVNV